jgi:hypothetical protein
MAPVIDLRAAREEGDEMIAKRIGIATALAVGLLLVVAAPALAVPGTLMWQDAVFHTGVVGDDVGVAVNIDGADNPVIAAKSATGVDMFEYLYWSYTPTGIWRGEGHWNGPTGSFETVNDQALDGAGRAMVVGGTNVAVSGDMYLVCRDNAGAFVWQDIYAGPAGGNDEAMAVAVDPSGDVFYTGMSEAKDGDMDVLTVMVDQDGTRVWADRYNSPYDRFDAGFAITRVGNSVYVAGTSNRTGHGDDLLLIRYNALNGNRTWVRRYDDLLHRNEFVSDVIATSTSVYVSGGGKGDAMLARYSTSGVRQWVSFFNAGGPDEIYTDLQRAPNGNIIVTGIGWRASTMQDWLTVAYRTNGQRRWWKWLTTVGKKSDAPAALDVDTDGRIYVTGSVASTANGADVRTVCYSSTGATVWGDGDTAFWNGFDNGDDVPWDIEVSSDAVWVVGTTYTVANGLDFLTLKYEK